MSVLKTNESPNSRNNRDNGEFTVNGISAFSDNYIWAIENQAYVALVDPGDADVCINYIETCNKSLSGILITHHHADHTGGIKKLVAYCQQKQWPITVYGPAGEKIPCCDIKLVENDSVNLPEFGITFDVIDLPGHTLGHIAYFTNKTLTPVLFCGDTLFSGGCGRIFEGTAEQMLASLSKLANLPDNTSVYCAHEYTQANLKFALTVDPNNEALINYNNKVAMLRDINQSTIPTTIKIEKLINPFLRSHEKALQQSANDYNSMCHTNSLDTFTTIRRWKDQF